MRLFIALDLPAVNDQNEPIQFVNTQLLIGQAIPDFRLVKSFHVTLIFIGEVAESVVPTIKIALERAVQEFIAEKKRGLANGIGGFMIMPGAAIMGKNAVAMKLIESPLLNILIEQLRKTLKENRICFDERYSISASAHVTLGRVPIEYKKQIEIKRFLELLPAPIGSRAALQETFTAHTITLYESLPQSEYRAIETYKI